MGSMSDGSVDVRYAVGLEEGHRTAAARLYDAAFRSKFALAIVDDGDRQAIVEQGLQLGYGMAAVAGDRLVGLAGFHSQQGSLTSGITTQQIMSRLGFVRGLRALFVFSLYDRPVAPGELLMDGIAVEADMRGQGIGGRLLDRIVDYARQHGYETVRLDVIDTNPRARQLYEKKGFVAMKTEHFPYLRKWLGFGASTTMVLNVTPNGQ